MWGKLILNWNENIFLYCIFAFYLSWNEVSFHSGYVITQQSTISTLANIRSLYCRPTLHLTYSLITQHSDNIRSGAVQTATEMDESHFFDSASAPTPKSFAPHPHLLCKSWKYLTCHSRQGNQCVRAPLRSRRDFVLHCIRSFVHRRGHHAFRESSFVSPAHGPFWLFLLSCKRYFCCC